MRLILRFVVFIFILSSCNIQYEKKFMANESGQEIFKMDMGGLMGMGKMLGESVDDNGEINEQKLEEQIEENLNEEEMIKMMESEEEVEDFSLNDLFGNPDIKEDMDSTMNVYEVMGDSLRNLPDAYLMKNAFARIQSNKEREEMIISIGIDYKDQKHREQIRNALPQFMGSKKSKKSALPEDSDKIFGEMEQLDLKKGILIIPPQELDDEMTQELGSPGEDEDMDLDDPETKMMMEMMLGDSGVKSTYTVPGKIEFTNDINAKIDGNTVTFFTPMIELLEMKEIPQKIIKFKPE